MWGGNSASKPGKLVPETIVAAKDHRGREHRIQSTRRARAHHGLGPPLAAAGIRSDRVASSSALSVQAAAVRLAGGDHALGQRDVAARSKSPLQMPTD